MDTLQNPIARYVSGGRYEFSQVQVGSVPAACQGLAARVSLVNVAAPGNGLTAGGVGVTDGAAIFTSSGSNTVTWTSGQGPLVDEIDNADSSIKILVVFRG